MLTDMQVYELVVAGVITAVVFPVLAAAVRKYFPQTQGGVPPWIKKYFVLLVFGVITGVVVFAYFKHEHPGPVTAWYEPFLAGFSWQSTIDAIFRPRARGKGTGSDGKVEQHAAAH